MGCKNNLVLPAEMTDISRKVQSDNESDQGQNRSFQFDAKQTANGHLCNSVEIGRAKSTSKYLLPVARI